MLRVGQIAGFVVSATLIGALARPGDWDEIELFWLLCGLTILSGAFPLEHKRVRASGTALGLVLTTVLLGPLPGFVVTVFACSLQSAFRRLGWHSFICNLAAFTMYPLVGGALLRLAQHNQVLDGPAGFPLFVFGVFLATNVANFLVVAIDIRVIDRVPVHRSLVSIYGPVLPVQLVSALLTATLALAYDQLGIGVVTLLGIVGLVFQYLLHLAFESMRRGEQLEQRTTELASLQVGLISTVLKTLAMRDKMTARHSAAVARYAREMAGALGMSERDQEVVHTAALLHDIGKFVFPDSILFANSRLSAEDLQIVRSHPEAGAELVRQIEGYGPVADIILAHHERVDGSGYPFGIAGDDIPLAARIISVADTYDVMTARDSYRQPVSSGEAIAELRRVSGSQLDAQVVDTFIALVEHRGIAFRHTDDSDFERELNLEQRVRDYAAPRIAA